MTDDYMKDPHGTLIRESTWFKEDEAMLAKSFSNWLLTQEDLDNVEYYEHTLEKALAFTLRAFVQWIYDVK